MNKLYLKSVKQVHRKHLRTRYDVEQEVHGPQRRA